MIAPYYEEDGITIYNADCRDVLPQLEPVDLVLTDCGYLVYTMRVRIIHKGVSTMIEITDMQAGKAGEYLVCADLILKGHIAFPSEQGLPFDVIADISSRLIRIQVKTTRTHVALHQRAEHTPGYIFHVRRMGKEGRGRYEDGVVDLFALVALDTREIGYVAARDVKTTMIFRTKTFAGKYRGEDKDLRLAIVKELKGNGASLREIKEKTGLDKSYISRLLAGKENRTVATGRYLADYELSKALEVLGA